MIEVRTHARRRCPAIAVQPEAAEDRPWTQATPDAPPGLQRRYRFFRSLLGANNRILEEMTGLERLIHEGRSFTLEEASGRVRSLVDPLLALWWKT